MIFEGPIGWEVTAGAMQAALRSANPTGFDCSTATVGITTALVLG